MNDLANYITQSFARGLKKPQIQANLLKIGWTKEQIETAFYSVEFTQKQFVERTRKRTVSKKLFLFLGLTGLAFILALIYFLLTTDISKSIKKDSPIKIKGDLICQKQTREALNFIKEKTPEEYNFVNRYLAIIECTLTGSGMYFTENSPRFKVGLRTRSAGTLWYASAIIHDACHSKQYQDGKQFSEAECLEFQAKAVEKMGGNQDLVNSIKDASDNEYEYLPNNW